MNVCLNVYRSYQNGKNKTSLLSMYVKSMHIIICLSFSYFISYYFVVIMNLNVTYILLNNKCLVMNNNINSNSSSEIKCKTKKMRKLNERKREKERERNTYGINSHTKKNCVNNYNNN